jgi:hypothetical protein
VPTDPRRFYEIRRGDEEGWGICTYTSNRDRKKTLSDRHLRRNPIDFVARHRPTVARATRR